MKAAKDHADDNTQDRSRQTQVQKEEIGHTQQEHGPPNDCIQPGPDSALEDSRLMDILLRAGLQRRNIAIRSSGAGCSLYLFRRFRNRSGVIAIGVQVQLFKQCSTD